MIIANDFFGTAINKYILHILNPIYHNYVI